MAAGVREDGSLCRPFVSEEEFGDELHQARWVGGDHVAEVGAADIAVDGGGAEELRVIEGVEGFDAELQGL